MYYFTCSKIGRLCTLYLKVLLKSYNVSYYFTTVLQYISLAYLYLKKTCVIHSIQVLFHTRRLLYSVY